ncbi:hypothetical protein AB395_00003897 [Sinorhizobium fredii CCBAU 45436]|nr:hypothetical protein SF83666_c37440 [Sinorhizobium fredii CCBAU 83666]AWI59524.1 hypothetical protein AB395_00003897 [Sinorhizobium fredii CCBAU 45436]AWM27203.1 hypothetical protein AOX55_00003979 [Sinorhizobium fredii CCBAU 25509]
MVRRQGAVARWQRFRRGVYFPGLTNCLYSAARLIRRAKVAP